MRLRDITIMFLIAGVFVVVIMDLLCINLSTGETCLIEDNYNSISNNANEDNFTSELQSIFDKAENTSNVADEFQDKVTSETTISLFSIGSATIHVVKNAVSFENVKAIGHIINSISIKIGVPPKIMSFLLSAIIITLVFTIVGAFLRWRS